MPAPDRVARRTVSDISVDLAGLGLVLAGVGWAVHVATSVGGDPAPVIAFAAVAVAAYVLARAVAEAVDWLPAAAVVTGTALLTLFPVPAASTYRSGMPFGPLGYANASAALYLLGAVAGVAIARLTSGSARWLGALAAAAATSAVLLSGSAATIALLLLLAASLFVRDARRTRALLGALSLLVLLGAASTWLLASRHASNPDEPLMQTAAAALSPERLVYWSEALLLAESHPRTGVGPGRFRELAPSAAGDPDAVAVHNDYLQASAELGIPGALVLASVMGWGFVRLAVSAGAPAAAPVGAGWAAVGLHASVDYVLHAPAVVVALAVLLATGAGGLNRVETGS